MEVERRNRIEKLAQGLANDYFVESYVDPYSAADDYDVTVTENEYVDAQGLNHYKAVIWCPDGRFVVHLNTKLLGKPHYSEARLTCAHELGHFFIEEHNKLLREGKTISFNGGEYRRANNPFEEEADLFAVNFLLPPVAFRGAALSFSAGLDGILNLKRRFRTSISCTAWRYVALGISPSLLVFWNAHGIWRKEIAPQLTGLLGDSLVKLNPRRVLSDKKTHTHNATKATYTSGYTFLSNWLIPTKKELLDLVVFEETFESSKVNISLITIPQNI